uniref:Ycf20 n=1 Tax=Caulerpa cliftonii TaxID=1004391 RepID=A0A1C9JBN9_9CHLO|nr:hypothetical protein [Caulerpa cliftonii]AOP19254.1 hypothetical protein [Caulerpa cliftonii]
MVRFWIQLKKRFNFKKKIFIFYFLESCCSFYLGLIFGNLFGTILVFIKIWDGIILFFLIGFFEYLNFKIYNKSLNQLKRLRPSNPILKRTHKMIQNIQLGLLLGFFIDAFKVGS